LLSYLGIPFASWWHTVASSIMFVGPLLPLAA
jgi:hypothetical protein